MNSAPARMFDRAHYEAVKSTKGTRPELDPNWVGLWGEGMKEARYYVWFPGCSQSYWRTREEAERFVRANHLAAYVWDLPEIRA